MLRCLSKRRWHRDYFAPPNLICISRSVFIMRLRAGSMLRKFRADYPAMLAVVAILFGTFVLGGIAYAYTHRPSELIDACRIASE